MTEQPPQPEHAPAQQHPDAPYGQPYPPPAYGDQQPAGGPRYTPAPQVQQPFYSQPFAAQPLEAPGQGLYTAAAVINWVVLGVIVVGTLGIGIIVAAWFIPMTIKIHQGARGLSKHTALGVCTLLFCNLISGILILVADGQRRPA